jgi:hypothetical protein
MKLFQYISAVILAPILIAGAATVTDEQIGYSLYLPDNWVRTEVDASQHLFEDTGGTYLSMIAVVKYDFSEETIFSSANEWTRANFISYAFSVDADPFSVMVFYDTVSAKQNEAIWAADAFSEFFSIDTTLDNWAEYIRFTASGTSGYEIYAIGPMEDMEVNVGFYLALIESITLTGISDGHLVGITVPKATIQNTVRQSNSENLVYDLLGRNTRSSRSVSSASNMVIYHTPVSVQRKLTLR